MKTNTQRRTTSALEPRTAPGRAAQRRGSALLIVIGTLALVAVFAAVYVSIGRTDRRSANALQARIDQRDTSIQISEYLAGIVGDDRLDAFPQYDFNGNLFAMREATDAPYTDWTRRSEVNSGNEHSLFTPSGAPFEMFGLDPDNDYRVASDPWLASTTPTYLGFPGDPINGTNDLRPFGSIQESTIEFPNATNYLDKRDWLQISNFAPDGRPVNLFNLRPSRSPFGSFSNEVGGFDAEPGYGTSPRADGRDIRRMSNYLSLLNVAEPGNPQSFLRAFDPVDTQTVWVPGYNQPRPIGLTGDEIANTPAVWTMYQRFMFMPMNQPFALLNRQGIESTWADPDYPPYQYADVDADGFADSRWFELRAARDAAEGSGNDNREDIQQLFPSGDMRYFIAARAVDLSSMVNVNTATDSLVTPTVEYPLGLTPAAVDLRRLLTMQDAAGDYTSVIQNSFGVPLSLSDAPRPYTTREDLAVPRSWAADGRPADFERDVRDYQFYQATIINSNRDIRTPDSNSPAFLIGRYAYDALRRAKSLGGSLTERFSGVDRSQFVPTPDRTSLVQYPGQIGVNPLPERVSAEDRYMEYQQISRQFAANPGLSTVSGQLFGLDDLAELLTYHGLNDPDFTSRLERVMDGRYDSGTPSTGSEDLLRTRRMGPMLSNRDLSLDRFSHSRILSDNDMRTAPYPDNQSDLRRIGEVSRNSMALMEMTPRKRMTPLSGHVALSPDARVGGLGTNPTDVPSRIGLDQSDALPLLSQAISNPTELFGIYGSTLASELEDMRGQAWLNDLTTRDDQAYSTLFYGHRGPELALRIAAHMSVNTKDLTDNDQTPSVATLLLDNDRRDELRFGMNSNFPDNVNDSDPSNQWYRDFPGRAAQNLFDPAPDDGTTTPTVLADNELDNRRKAVNVFGIEPMPVITEVSTFYVFHDAADTLALDSDFLDARPRRRSNGLVGPIPDDGDLQRITIDGTLDYEGNRDYLMQCVAFQLHNPWDEPISLGGDGLGGGAPLTRMRDPNDPNMVDASTNQYQFGYYIEWNGYFFKLAQLQRFYPSDSSIENYRPFDENITGVPNNPAFDISPNGGYLDPGTYPDFIGRNIVMGPGETRVFYAVGDHRFDQSTSNLLIDNRWLEALSQHLAFNFDDSRWTDTGPDANGDGIPDYDLDEDGVPDGNDGRGWTGPAQEFLENQLSPSGLPPVLTHPMNPQTGEYLDTETAVYDFLNTPGNIGGFDQISSTTNRVDVDEVRLWMKITTPGEEENDPMFTSRITENLLHNDLLVDRMDISDTGIAEPLATGEQEIEGTTSFPEDYPSTQAEIDAQVRNDNTGYTIMRWASTRRRESGDVAYMGDNFEVLGEEIGQIREWMLSSRIDPTGAVVNTRDQYDNTPTIEDFRQGVFLSDSPETDIFLGFGSGTETDYEVWRFLNTMFTNLSVVVTADLPPYLKDDLNTRYPNNGDGSEIKFDENDGTDGRLVHLDDLVLHEGDTTGSDLVDLDSIPTTATEVPRPQLPSGAGVNPERPRLADLLLGLGIGPTHAPDQSLSDADAEYYPEEWMTFSEALAVALGYERPDGTDWADSVWTDTWRVLADRDQRVLEGGRLALDRFVPFVNAIPGENPNEFNEGTDRLRGSGALLAAGVVDRARAVTRSIEDLRRPTDRNITAEQLALTRATFGTININTAPLEVLRLLPGLSPSRAQYVDENGITVPEWWGADAGNYSDLRVPDLVPSSPSTDYDELRENPDVAAAIVAYRDRTYGIPNTAARPEPGAENFYANAPFFLRPEQSSLNTVAQNMIGEIPATQFPDPANPSVDRSFMTGINGLRSTPGFASLGELFSVRADPGFNVNTTPTVQWGMWRHLSMDQLGFDARSQGVADHVNGSDRVTILPEVYGEFVNNRVGNTVDDYAERLSIANGVLNMLSVRSDYYAVWFIVQGYRESDVANLRPEDPLIPSLHKRYIMVIDRSNVVETGDKPKILLLKEVPL